MAIPAAVIATAAEALRNPLVRDTAVTVFDWLRQQRSERPSGAAKGADVAALLADVPTRAELAIALSQIDVRIAEAERRCIRVLGGSIVGATAILAALIIFL